MLVTSIQLFPDNSFVFKRSQQHYGKRSRSRERWFYLLISPCLIGFVIFKAGPLLSALVLAFFEWPLPQPAHFVGLQHFQTLALDTLFWRSLLNTGYYALGTVPSSVALSLTLALLLNAKRQGQAIFSTFIFVPSVLSGVAIAYFWGWLFNPRFGPVNSLLATLGIQGPGWLYDQAWALPTLMLLGIWGLGGNMVIFLAALQGIPSMLYEAAKLDGAGPWQRFYHITWSQISPVTFFLIVVNSIAAFQVFTPTYILTRGGPDNATLTLPLYMYMNAFFYGRLGYASALAIALLLMVAMLAFLQFRLLERHVFYAAID